MKKIFVYLTVLCCALVAHAETEFTFTSADDMNQTKDGISMVIAQGGGQNAPMYQNPYYNSEYHPEMRLYLGNTITISSDQVLTNIQLVCAKSNASNKDYAGLSASTGTLVPGGVAADATDWQVDSWTGNATQVEFTLTVKGQRQIQRILIDGEPIEIQPVVEILPTEEDLIADYTYEEPTEVTPKDTTVIKKEYAFINNNILVHCTLGSILKAEADSNPDDEEDDSHPAYFNCNANYQLTFTASKPIKGISIDGFVRKAFNATCDKGSIQFLTDPDRDMEGWPALVIMDIDANSVTLDCPKQLRCYGVHVFFEENPDPIEETEPDTTDLVMSGALAEDYSDNPDYSEEGHYSYWLKLSSENTYPQVWLDLYTAVKGDLSGTYSPYDFNIGESTYVIFSDDEEDYVTAYDMDVTIEHVGDGYAVNGVLTCWEKGREWDDESEDLVYRFSYEGPVAIGQPEGIEQVLPLEGEIRKVLRDGQVMIIRNGRTFTTLGAEIQ